MPDLSKPVWLYLLAISVAVLVAAAIGFLFGQPLLFVTLMLASLLVLQLRNLVRFEHWLRNRRSMSPPNMPGLWGEAVSTTNRIYRRKIFHKRRVMLLLREFRRMTAAMPDGAILLGSEREILWFNRAAARWLNLRRKVDFGNRIDNLLRHPDFVRYLESRGKGPEPRIFLPQLGGRWLAFRLVTTGAEGQQLLIIRDVSNEARLDSMRKDFVANASHELRSPLTVISGYIDALSDDAAVGEDWHVPAQEMRRQSNRMRGILQDLLELSRLEASGGEAEREPVDVGGMLALLRKDALARPERPATVTLQADSDDLLLGSETELNSIFSNLLSNAVKYTPPDGGVRMRWWTDELGAHVEVSDTGIGISAQHLPRLTERFYRVDPGRSRKLGGSGLGLAIVKHALQRHGAQLRISSTEGEGSNFTCHFPRERVASRASAAKSSGLVSS